MNVLYKNSSVNVVSVDRLRSFVDLNLYLDLIHFLWYVVTSNRDLVHHVDINLYDKLYVILVILLLIIFKGSFIYVYDFFDRNLFRIAVTCFFFFSVFVVIVEVVFFSIVEFMDLIYKNFTCDVMFGKPFFRRCDLVVTLHVLDIKIKDFVCFYFVVFKIDYVQIIELLYLLNIILFYQGEPALKNTPSYSQTTRGARSFGNILSKRNHPS